MEKSIISEGKTTNEAIEKGLKQLQVSKEMVNIKILENEDKRSFFSILAPRIVKVQLTLKEMKTSKERVEKREIREIKPKREVLLSEEEQNKAVNNIKQFMEEFQKNLPEDTTYHIEKSATNIKVYINSQNLGYLIGYRGETLYAMQTILSSIASKGIDNRIRVILDIQGYKEKRQKTLEELAQKVAATVIRTKKSITLEPMQAYERKIIHSKLQQNKKVETTSIGEEPHRRIVISLKNN